MRNSFTYIYLKYVLFLFFKNFVAKLCKTKYRNPETDRVYYIKFDMANKA